MYSILAAVQLVARLLFIIRAVQGGIAWQGRQRRRQRW